jgi:hypothetical protein
MQHFLRYIGEACARRKGWTPSTFGRSLNGDRGGMILYAGIYAIVALLVAQALFESRDL